MQTPCADYSVLNRAQLTFDYLHTNSTTHEFIFGALAELVDNSRDAEAENLYIYSVSSPDVRGGQMIYFVDDGCGMDPDETVNVMSFGKSEKRSSCCNSIGQYGNGLKSGSMRVANDFILFTKRSNAYTCLFLSRTFHEDENIEEVIVPIPSFDVRSGEPLLIHGKNIAKHELEMQLILKYSPFHDMQSVMEQFRSISGKTGTIVVLFNLKLLDNGRPELDVSSVPQDIRLAASSSADKEAQESLQPEWQSLREYVGILYYDPRMKVHLQGKKVLTKKLINMLYKPRMYRYTSNRFKTRAEQDLQRAQDDLMAVKTKLREVESRVLDTEQRLDSLKKLKQSERLELCKNRFALTELKEGLERKKKTVETKQRLVKEPKKLHFIFGVNIDARRQDGMFLYNNSRLIRMYEKVGRQSSNDIAYAGVVGVVNIPLMILEPTHNKQNFADRHEYKMLLRAMKDHMEQYWRDIGFDKRNVIQFWLDYGYDADRLDDPPSNESWYIRKRRTIVGKWLQCDNCLKWRKIAFSRDVSDDVPENWICSMNTDSTQNRCTLPEKSVEIEEGTLQKGLKTKEAEVAAIKSKMDKLQKDYARASCKVYNKRDIDNVMKEMKFAAGSFSSQKLRKRKRTSSSEDEYIPRVSSLSRVKKSERLTGQSKMTGIRTGQQYPLEVQADGMCIESKPVIVSDASVPIFDDQHLFGAVHKSAALSDSSIYSIHNALDNGECPVVVQSLRDTAGALFSPTTSEMPPKTRALRSGSQVASDNGGLQSLSQQGANKVSPWSNQDSDSLNASLVTMLLNNYRTVLLRMVPDTCSSYRNEIEAMNAEELANLSPNGVIASFDKEHSNTMKCVDKQLASTHSDLNELRNRVAILLSFLDKELSNLRPTPTEIRQSLERMIELYESKVTIPR